ncbi:hypothetical protein VJ923_06755 [Adlercreutzia sp. R25]|uniref:hypothetical protein n=1 Tax=Adlercreutzia shanghongiae TaxID=3111773 RepID=UPI002DBF52B3|nr:hypothetical protein [Adlercreutzia sp. R25]MEC4272855.1 hypothetical protein [Adlercreutzia sp. R25]
MPVPVHVLVPRKSKSPIPDAVAHASHFAFKEKPFIRIADGVFVACPELCFVQLACDLPFHELIKVGSALCGTFVIDSSCSNGLAKRAPITTTRRIEAFIRRNPGIRGAKAARRAVKCLAENAASPPEAFLWTVMSLAQRYGGYGIPGLELNRRIAPSKKAQRLARRKTLVPDIVHASSRLSLEYDSNSEHLTPDQISRDASKRLALEADGFKVITVTLKQLSSSDEMRGVAEQSCKRMGRRFQIQSKNFRVQHRLLYACGWSLRAYRCDGFSEDDTERKA